MNVGIQRPSVGGFGQSPRFYSNFLSSKTIPSGLRSGDVVGDLALDQKATPAFFEKVIGAYIEAPLVEKIMS
ncbi:hypothetical protein ABE125_20795 [Bacillus subtilis]